MKVVRLVFILLAAAVMLWALACGSNNILGGGPQRDLNANQHKWEDANLTNYGYRLRRACFCPNTNLVQVTVFDGTITAVADVESGEELDADQFQFYHTIDDLFDIVRDAIENADSLAVTYDDELGYPTQITIDYIRQAIDDELAITASDVLPLLTVAK